MWAEPSEPFHLETRKCICYIIADSGNVLDVDLHIVLHGEEHEGMDKGHHGLAASGGLGHNMHYRHIITMKEEVLPS